MHDCTPYGTVLHTRKYIEDRLQPKPHTHANTANIGTEYMAPFRPSSFAFEYKDDDDDDNGEEEEEEKTPFVMVIHSPLVYFSSSFFFYCCGALLLRNTHFSFC